jgi:hypothetical protein
MKIEFIIMKFKYALAILAMPFFSIVVNAQNTLDQISLPSTSPASVAYSLRKLSGTYAGPLVRIKVGTSFYDVYPDLSTNKFTLNSKISASISTYNAAVSAAGANALSSIITAGSTNATISIWYDQSGNAIHVYSINSTAKIITAGSIHTLNGQPTVKFSTTDSYLESSSTVNYSSQSGATVSAIAQNAATSSFGGIIGTANGISYPGYNTSYSSGVGYQSDANGCGYGSNVITNDPKMITSIFINTTTNLSKIYVNGVLKTNTAVTANTCSLTHTSGSKIYIGSARGVGSYSFNGNISEAIIFPNQMSAGDQTLLETNQTAFYFAPYVTITSSASGAVCAGTSVTFTATAFNFTGTPTYQWVKNGATIPGATSSTYTTTTLSNNDQIQVYVNGGINSANIVSNGLKLNLDASNPSSYAGAGTTWYDLSGNNNHATLNNSPTYEVASGSIVTNGTSQYLSVPLFNNSVTNVTMQAWVYINTPSKGVFIANGYGNGYNVGIGNSGFESDGSNASMLFSGARWMFNTNTYTAGWHLVTMVLNGSSTPFIYVDNVLKGSSTGYPGTAPNTPTGYLTLGAIPNDNGRYYAGKFAAAYFYDRALTLSEITQNYNAFSTKSTAFSSNTITNSISGSIPAIEIIGDACVNKTTLSTNSGLTSYAWYKDDVIISGATSNTFTPTSSGSYKVQVTSGSCSSSSSATNITNCSVASDGSMKLISYSNSIISPEGGANFGTGRDYAGKLYNTTGITTTSGTIGSSTAVLGGIISPTNNVTTSIGVIYSTDNNFGTYSSTTIQSNVAAGTYSSTITGLTSSTNYFAKSFIVNKAGTSYGTVVSFTTTTPPPVLGASYGGGNVAHIFTSGDPGYVAGEYHGIIISSVWMNDGVGTSWSSNLTQTNATSLIYGGGLTNTNTIYSLLGTNAYAVNLCKTYSVTQNGITYSDWVLPSLNELLRIATNLTGNGFGTIWTSNRCSNCNWSWSSSELASNSTDVQVMDNGNLGTFGLIKSESGGNRVIVRAIRYF